VDDSRRSGSVEFIAGDKVSRDLVFKFRLDNEDKERLEWLAKHYCATEAVVVRMLIKRAYEVLIK